MDAGADNACVILFSIDDLLVIGVAEESQRHTVGAQSSSTT